MVFGARGVRYVRDAEMRSRGLCALLICVGALAGCDRGSRTEPLGPEVHLEQTSPHEGEGQVPVNGSIFLRFDRYLNPASVLRQSLELTPVRVDKDAGAGYVPTYYLEPVYDPYERMVVYRNSPGRQWMPTTWHTLFVRAPQDDMDLTGFRAIDGAPLHDTKVVEFMTSTSEQPDANGCDDGAGAATYCEDGTHGAGAGKPSVRSVLQQGCAKAGCHVAGHGLGLDLSSANAVRMTAIGVVARQTLHGPSISGVVSSNPTRLGVDMPRLDPYNPGNSYLVYKLLINERNHPTIDDISSESDCWIGSLLPTVPPSIGELDRLRNRLIVGGAMPPDGALTPWQMRALVRWIIAGATVPSDCD